jgi:hypothetical protein
MTSYTNNDYRLDLKQLLDASADPLWATVVMNWLERFDGWWTADRAQARNPAYAITLAALRHTPLTGDASRTALYLARLPFNRWHAVTVPSEVAWSPLKQGFDSFRIDRLPEPVITFLAPQISKQRLGATVDWLWAMWQVQRLGQAGPHV